MDPILRAALKRREELVQEIEKTDKIITFLKVVAAKSSGISDPAISAIDPLADAGDQDDGVSPLGHDLSGTEPGRSDSSTRMRGDSPAKIVAATREILQTSGRPMKRGELLESLDALGIRVGGSDRSKVLGTILWRANDEIVNLRSFGFWMKDVPYAPANYIPGTDNGSDLV